MSSSKDPSVAEKRPHDTPFKQQRLKTWTPILTPKKVIFAFLFIAVVFFLIGGLIVQASNDVIDVGPLRYDADSDAVAKNVTFRWPKTTTDTVYFYYQLSNFYQNHRRYVRSRSDVQLSGTSLEDVQTLGNCDPWEYWDDHAPNNAHEIDPNPENYSKYHLNPCGLIANSMFNDTFALFKGDGESGTCPLQAWSKEGIAWKTDREKKFNNYEGCEPFPTADEPNPQCDLTVQQRDVEDEEFIVWMRTVGLPTFKKLHRIIDGGLEEGTYTLQIDQHFPVKSFDGEKGFYLTTTSWMGGKNYFLGWAYIATGILSFVLAVAFFIKDKMDPRQLGDPANVPQWTD